MAAVTARAVVARAAARAAARAVVARAAVVTAERTASKTATSALVVQCGMVVSSLSRAAYEVASSILVQNRAWETCAPEER